MHGIDKDSHSGVGIYLDGLICMTSGFSRTRIWRGIKDGLLDRCFTELYMMSCDTDSAAACAEAGSTVGNLSFIIAGPSSII